MQEEKEQSGDTNTVEFFCDEISVCFIEGNTMVDYLECPPDYVPVVIEIEFNGVSVFKQINGRVFLDLTERCNRWPDLNFILLPSSKAMSLSSTLN